MSCLVLAPLGSILPWKPNCAVNPVGVYFIQQISAHSALGLVGFTLSFLAPGASYTLLNVTLSVPSLLSASWLALSGALGVTLCLYVPSVKSSFKSSIFIFRAQSWSSSFSLRKLSSLLALSQAHASSESLKYFVLFSFWLESGRVPGIIILSCGPCSF